MNKKEKALEIIRECYQYGVATVASGVFLEASGFLRAQAETWADDDPGRAIDYRSYPYWITTDNGILPVGITDADDPDLLNAIE